MSITEQYILPFALKTIEEKKLHERESKAIFLMCSFPVPVGPSLVWDSLIYNCKEKKYYVDYRRYKNGKDGETEFKRFEVPYSI